MSDEEIERSLTEWIISEDLLKSGHYIIDENRVARDWIDVEELLKNKEYFNHIINKFIEKVDKTNHYLIIGVDFNGLMMSSLIAFKTGNKVAHAISKNDSKFSMQELDLSLCEFKDLDDPIIIITDVLVTGETIEKVIKKYGIRKEKVMRIFSIFKREMCSHQLCNTCNGRVVSETHLQEHNCTVLNSQIAIEICLKTKDECLFRKNNIDLYSNKPH
jgi:orotate phosphoribosyltransferase